MSASLVNRAALKRALLDEAKKRFGGKFTRVSADVYVAAEHRLRAFVAGFVQSHPTVGKTLMVANKTRTRKESEDGSL